MFDFLFKDKKGEVESYMDIISVDGAKLLLSKFAIEKAVGMIANAIAKSEFVVQRKGERVKDELYWRLNIQPNDNETATDFWKTVVRRLLIRQEALVCILNGKYYIVDSYNISDVVLRPNSYKNIVISCNGKTYQLDKEFAADEILHFRTRGEKKKQYLDKVVSLYDSVLSAYLQLQKISSAPKFRMAADTNISLMEKNENGEKRITREEYKGKIEKILESDDLSVIMLGKGITLEPLKIESQIKSEDIKKMSEEIFTGCAMEHDIPISAFMGTITEKSDATNEFITYAVSPVKEIINDSVRAKIVGQAAFANGDDVWIDVSHFKHVDILDSAANMDKLRSIGFNLDELRQTIGWEPLDTEFSQERVVTKNYTTDLEGGEGSDKEL